MTRLLVIIFACLCVSCYHHHPSDWHDALSEQDSAAIADSISFYTTHHYTVGYNFQVRSDSLTLLSNQPEEHVSMLVIDTFAVPHGTVMAVSEIRRVPQDTIDSVWVQLVAEQGQTGWVHETTLLPAVVPTDPVSQFIMFFSDTHLIIALALLALLAAAYLLRTLRRRQAHIVHLNDILSPYPTALCLIVATAATFYASIQMFAPDAWRHFYYHPTLNPFMMPGALAVFIACLWAMAIAAIAAIDDTRRLLPTADALLYLAGLAGVCAVLYIVFSISTLYYIGYPLLAAYYWYAITKLRKQ